MKHTQGDWYVSKVVNDLQVIAPTANQDVALVYKNSRSIPEEEATANANLIAAAPDLLEAVMLAKELYERLEPAGGYQYYHDTFIHAINKAVPYDTEG